MSIWNNNRGGFYHLMVAVGIIVIVAVPWTFMSDATVELRDTFKEVTDDDIAGDVGNSTQLDADYDLGESVFYASFFFISILLLVWAFKETQEEESVGVFTR